MVFAFRGLFTFNIATGCSTVYFCIASQTTSKKTLIEIIRKNDYQNLTEGL